jgi:hypothetical protein
MPRRKRQSRREFLPKQRPKMKRNAERNYYLSCD